MRAILLILPVLLLVSRPARADYFLSNHLGLPPAPELQCRLKQSPNRPLPCGGCSFEEVEAHAALKREQVTTKDEIPDSSAMVAGSEILFQKTEIDDCMKTPKRKEWCDFMVKMNEFNRQFNREFLKFEREAITNRRSRQHAIISTALPK